MSHIGHQIGQHADVASEGLLDGFSNVAVAGHVGNFRSFARTASDTGNFLAVGIKGIENNLHGLSVFELVEFAADEVPALRSQWFVQLFNQCRLAGSCIACEGDEFPLPTLHEHMLKDMKELGKLLIATIQLVGWEGQPAAIDCAVYD